MTVVSKLRLRVACSSYLLQAAGLEVLELLLKTDVRIRDGTAHPDDFERLLPGEIGGAHDVGHRHRHAPRHSRQTVNRIDLPS